MPPRTTMGRSAVTSDIYADARHRRWLHCAPSSPILPDDIAARVEVTPHARSGAWRHGDQRRAGRGQGRASAAGETCSRHRRASASGDRHCARRAPPGPGFVNLQPRPPRCFARCCRTSCAPAKPYGDSTHRQRHARSTSSMSPPTRPGRCISAIAAAPWSATRWPTCWRKAGYDVTKEYYINDAGAQVTALAWAAYWRYLQAIGTPLDRSGFLRRGARRAAISRRLPDPDRRTSRANSTAHRSAQPDGGIAAPEVWLDIVRDFTIAAMMQEIREDLHLLGVDQDVFSSERALIDSGAVDAVDRMVADARTDLRGRAGSAEGQDAGRLGAAAADAVPRHAVRRRRGSAAAQIRWLATRTLPTTSPITPTRCSAATTC